MSSIPEYVSVKKNGPFTLLSEILQHFASSHHTSTDTDTCPCVNMNGRRSGNEQLSGWAKESQSSMKPQLFQEIQVHLEASLRDMFFPSGLSHDDQTIGLDSFGADQNFPGAWCDESVHEQGPHAMMEEVGHQWNHPIFQTGHSQQKDRIHVAEAPPSEHPNAFRTSHNILPDTTRPRPVATLAGSFNGSTPTTYASHPTSATAVAPAPEKSPIGTIFQNGRIGCTEIASAVIGQAIVDSLGRTKCEIMWSEYMVTIDGMIVRVKVDNDNAQFDSGKYSGRDEDWMCAELSQTE
ncbi:hypothetical protein EK21DRAFT_89879 [Setomelanomma holmii]|uniref:Uncharacterized protein n=1 Tax=Setomelanomma holmii TaxID=210430 RepID=A0A9P4LJK5_9PLEO|nr:hypothetical protein EK21DRAFT_89879 [Setomelanomma holmii]